MQIAVVGGGINGIMSAWAMASAGASVTLFEADKLLSGTSSASSRMLHGGIRYLENFQIGFVKEALCERAWWRTNAPELSRTVRFHIPVRAGDRRSTTVLRFGVWLYDRLAGKHSVGASSWIKQEQLLQVFPLLNRAGLKGAASYVDVVMDDIALGTWAATKARDAGVEIHEGCRVDLLEESGSIQVAGKTRIFDKVVNAAGPWAGKLAEKSGLRLPQITLLKGSHLILKQQFDAGLLLQSNPDGRAIFVIPCGAQSIVGTTEVPVETADNPAMNDNECEYLLQALAGNMNISIENLQQEVIGSYSGIRVLAGDGKKAGRISRDHHLTWTGNILHVLGGKWTTSRRLGQDVAVKILGKQVMQNPQNIIWRNL